MIRSETIRVTAAGVVRSPDGHYWAEGVVNATRVHFLVDTGATAVALGAFGAHALKTALEAAAPSKVRIQLDFLQALTDESFMPQVPVQVPSGLPPVDARAQRTVSAVPAAPRR